MSVDTCAVFLTHLEQSGLMSAEQIEPLRAADCATSVDLAKRLIQEGRLTKWQAQELLKGNHRLQLGSYRLVAKLGAGGMGTVYQAVQIGIDRAVALKVMSEELAADKSSVRRFLREVTALSSLRHPNIVSAYDADHDGNSYFLVMEYVEGRDLSSWLKEQQQLPVRWACECIRQAALGLEHAHQKGLIHRDIKPGNLLVVGDLHDVPTVKILDLGLARYAHSDGERTELTQTGEVLGTPDYMAPEQGLSNKPVDTRTDVYSLGCTLYKLLTGKVPFRGETPLMVMVARASKDPPRVSECAPDIAPELDDLIFKAMAREQEDRFQTPGELATALEPFCISDKETEQDGCLLTVRMSDLDAANRPTDGFTEGQVSSTPEPIPTGAPGSVTDFDIRSDRFAPPPRKASRMSRTVLSVGAIAVAGFVGLFIFALSDRTQPTGTLVLQLRPDRAAIAQVKIDGQRVSLDRRGRREHACPLGTHRVEARCWGFEPFIRDVTLTAEAATDVLPNWKPRATLDINWPAALRSGATIDINGQRRELGALLVQFDSQKAQLAIEPGEVTIVLRCTGFEPLSRTFSVVAGDALDWPCEWTPHVPWLDLFTSLDLARCRKTGSWDLRANGAELVATAGSETNSLDFPLDFSDASYDLEIEVTQTSRDEPIRITLPVADGALDLVLDKSEDEPCALQTLHGESVGEIDSAFKPVRLATGARQRWKISVRDQISTTSVKVHCNHQLAVAFQGERSTAAVESAEVGSCAISTAASIVVHRAQLRPLAGRYYLMTEGNPAWNDMLLSVDPKLLRPALEFTGDAYVRTGLVYGWRGTITLEAIFVPYQLGAEAPRQMLLSNQAGSGMGLIVQDDLRFYLHGRGNELHVPADHVRGRRTHVAGILEVHEGGFATRCYVNGKLQAQGVPEPGFKTRSAPFFVAANPNNQLVAQNLFQGIIEQVRVSRQAMYDADFQPPQQLTADAATVMLYHLDQSTGDKLQDASRNGCHGRIVGGRWIKVLAPHNALQPLAP